MTKLSLASSSHELQKQEASEYETTLHPKNKKLTNQPTDRLTLNDHLHPHLVNTNYQFPTYLTNLTQSSVLFEKLKEITLTKSTYKVISYVDFKHHAKIFQSISSLLIDTQRKLEYSANPRRYEPNLVQPQGPWRELQNRKNTEINIHARDTKTAIKILRKNFELMRSRFFQVTGLAGELNPRPEDEIPLELVPDPQKARRKWSVMSSLFSFLFGGDSDSSEL